MKRPAGVTLCSRYDRDTVAPMGMRPPPPRPFASRRPPSPARFPAPCVRAVSR
jgi:hypothetical protein